MRHMLMRNKLPLLSLVSIVCCLISLWAVASSCSDAKTPPYLPSSVVADVTFDWSTHDRRAEGSDNWPVTWADDDHQYTSWGDGGGFEGTNRDGRVSLGVARIEGSASRYQGFNIWGGKDSPNPATFEGKSYGILSVDSVLFMWVSPGSDATNYEQAKLYESTNHGASWKAANWAFVKSEGLILPTFLQFGKGYRDARDDFVYVYAVHFKPKILSIKDQLRVQKPGEIALMRAHKTKIMDRSAYEFFRGLDGGKNPIWTKDLKSRRPVFEDRNGVGWNTSVSYNRGINRYLLITEHTATFRGNLGIFDAPAPWGPWTTAKYTSGFGASKIEPTSFFWNFSNKWLSPDGQDFTLVFTGTGQGTGNDSWNTVKGTFVMAKHPVQ